MNTPRDYAEKPSSNGQSSAEANTADPITIVNVVDRFKANKPITDQMINDACRQMDSVYHFKNLSHSPPASSSLIRFIKSVF